MRVWTNKRTGKRYHKGDFSMVVYRHGKTRHGPTTGLAKYRHKKRYASGQPGSYYDSKWAGH